MPRGPCGPPACPSPPVSVNISRAPYAPSWIATLTPSWFGKLLVIADGALQSLKSKCSGWIYYDAATENVIVDGQPPFISSIPKETDFGYLGLVVPKVQQICEDGSDACGSEIRQEVASQVLGFADCGDLLLVNSPLCGQIPPEQAADAMNQIRLDRAALPELDDQADACQSELRLLGFLPWTRKVGNQTVACTKPVKVRRIRMPASQWGSFSADNDGADEAMILLAVPVDGGTELDPCMELQMSQFSYSRFSNLGATRHYLPKVQQPFVLNTTTLGAHNVVLPNFPVVPLGTIVTVELRCSNIEVDGAGSVITVQAVPPSTSSYLIGEVGVADGTHHIRNGGFATTFDTRDANVNFLVSNPGAAATSLEAKYQIAAYYY